MEELIGFIGKTIKSVDKNSSLDHGFILEFTDGSILEVCYNNDEGYINEFDVNNF